MSFYAPAYDPAHYPASQPNRNSGPSPTAHWLLPSIHLGTHLSALGPQDQPIPPPAPLFSSFTPPPNHQRPLHAAVQLPSLRPFSTRTTHLSPYLNPGGIDWTIRTLPATTLCPQEHARVGKNTWRQEIATSPALPFIVIRVLGCSNTITVFPGPDRVFVTVGDILDAVYRAPNCALCAELECDCPGCLRLGRLPRHARSQSDAAGIPQGSVLLTDDRVLHPRPQHPALGGVERWRWLGLVASATEPGDWTLLLDSRRGLGRIA